MKPTERVVIYTSLCVLSAITLVLLLSSSGRSAFAEASAWLQQLGPAESLILTGEGGKEITIRNKAGRIAWADGDFKQAYTIGFVDLSRALNPLMESESFLDERDALRQEFAPAEADFRSRLERVAEQLRGLEPNSPEFRQRQEEWQRIYQEYGEWAQQVQLRRNQLDVKHLESAYRELTAAVDVVADKLGVDIVLRFIPTEKEFQAQDAEGALTEIRLRAALKYPQGLDITEEVLEELNVQDTNR